MALVPKCFAWAAILLGLTALTASADAQSLSGPAKPPNNPLPTGAVASIGSPRFVEPGRTEALVMSPDGRHIVSLTINSLGKPQIGGSWSFSFTNFAMHVWDTATGNLVRSLPLPAPYVRDIALSPDGKTLAVLSANKGITLLDFPDGENWKDLAGTQGKDLAFVGFSADGKRLWTRGYVGKVYLWDTITRKHLGEVPEPEKEYPVAGGCDAIYGVPRLSPDGKIFACSARRFEFISGDPKEQKQTGECIKLFDAQTGKPRFSTDVLPWTTVLPLLQHLFSPDSRFLIVAGEGLSVYDTVSGKLVHQLDGKSNHKRRVAVSPDCTRLVSVAYDTGHAQCWDLKTGELSRQFWIGPKEYHDIGMINGEAMRPIVFAPDNKSIWLNWNKAIRGWDVTTGQEIAPVAAHREEVKSVSFSADSTRLMSNCKAAWAEWDAATGKQLKFIDLYKAKSGQFLEAFSVAHDRALWSTGVSSKYEIKELLSGKLICSIETPKKSPGYAPVRFFGKSLWIGEPNFKAGCVPWQFDPHTGKDLGKIAFAEVGSSYGFTNMAATPDGELFASCSQDGRIILLDPASGKVVRKFSDPLVLAPVRKSKAAEIYRFAFSPNGKYLASVMNRFSHAYDSASYAFNAIQVWDVATGWELCRFAAPLKEEMSFVVTDLAVSSDGRFVAFGMYGETAVHVWEVASASERGTFRGHDAIVTALAFSPDGKRLASGGADSMINIWDMNRPFHAKAAFKEKLSDKELAVVWTSLGKLNAAEADTAIWSLVYAAGQSVPWLKEKLKPVKPVAEAHLKKLIVDLESDVYAVRQKALLELEAAHDAAGPALTDALKGKLTLEGKLRVESLLGKIKSPLSNPAELQFTRALEVLERIGTEPAREVLAEIAKGVPHARRTQQAQACLDRCKALQKS